jgi:hypothetical protein
MYNTTNEIAPVVLFVYNRPIHAENTILSLANNDLAQNTDLYIFSDGPKNIKDNEKVSEVRTIIDQYSNIEMFRSVKIIKENKNRGLAQSIIEGVSHVLEKHNQVIVLEDDLLFSNDYLLFMNNALNYYALDLSIGSVTGYNPLAKMPNDVHDDIYVTQRNCSLGWGTWKRVWYGVDWNINDYYSFKHDFFKRRRFNSTGMDRSSRLDNQIKKNGQSWSIRFGYNLFKQNFMKIPI